MKYSKIIIALFFCSSLLYSSISSATVINLGNLKLGAIRDMSFPLTFTRCWSNKKENSGNVYIESENEMEGRFRPTGLVHFRIYGEDIDNPNSGVVRDYYNADIVADTGVVLNGSGVTGMSVTRHPEFHRFDTSTGNLDWFQLGVSTSGWNEIRRNNYTSGCNNANGKFIEFTVNNWVLDTSIEEDSFSFETQNIEKVQMMVSNGHLSNNSYFDLVFTILQSTNPTCDVTIPNTVNFGMMQTGASYERTLSMSFHCTDVGGANINFKFMNSTIMDSNRKVETLEGSFLELFSSDYKPISINDPAKPYRILNSITMSDPHIPIDIIIRANNKEGTAGGVFNKVLNITVTVL